MSEELEHRFLDYIAKHPGTVQSKFESELGCTQQDILAVVNQLIKQGRIITYQAPDGSTSFKEVAPEDVNKFKGLTSEDLLIFQLVESSGNKGSWTKDLKYASGLQQVQITKIMKLLENRKLIKAVKSVQTGRKKVYMLYNMEPAREVTGGSLYGSDQNYDDQYIHIIKMHIKSYVQNKGTADQLEIIGYLKRVAEDTSQTLSPEDVLQLINTLIYDGDLEEIRDTRAFSSFGKRGILYKPTKTVIPVNNFGLMPCGTCPVFDLCSPEGEISPKKCVYFTEYLKQINDEKYDDDDE
ncbi:RNA polymerase III subunit [Tieghemostelium lacteum]|uniref:DNA-directed RNA polymerase III subunit RPC6 n=1 Tax=Tieghemostelium lacteum TaxID=361077 RepID=A0A151ZHE8_TIELA|nr:RNA polymerase III subunit [Tieghemostelium lacteum]|eukprot:KYQ93393.1 RNA polymerase III subunit [Tieghemostelium lacteum]